MPLSDTPKKVENRVALKKPMERETCQTEAGKMDSGRILKSLFLECRCVWPSS